jgi:hypothetical protein
MLIAVLGARASAQPAGGDIEMGGDDAAKKQPPPPAHDAAKPTDAPAADASQRDPKLAKKLVAAGEQHAKKGDYLNRVHKDAKPEWQEAATAYAKALELGDDVNVYFALGEIEEKLGNLADALHAYKKVTTATAGVRPEIAKQAATHVDDVTSKVGLVTFELTPDGATVTVGDSQVGTAPMTEPLVMLPGKYTFALAAAGYQPKQVELQIDAGSEVQKKIDLDPVPVIVKPVKDFTASDTDTASPAPPAPIKWPLYAGIGGTVAFAGVATVTGILAIKQHDTFVAPDTKKDDRLDAQDNGRTLSKVNDVMIGGAVVVAAGTAAYYFLVYRPRHADYEKKLQPAGKTALRSKVDIVPWVQSGSGGLVLGGQF